MDDETRQLLKEIRDLQLEQLQLTQKILSGVPTWLTWRFSLLHMMVGVTIVAVVLGLLILSN